MTVALVANIARPISSAISTAFQSTDYGYMDAYGKLGAWSPLSLFAASEVGAWYDPSDLSTMFQDSAGTTPVTADGQPVGLILDKSKGLVLGPELVTNGGPNFVNTTGWVPQGTGGISVDAGRLKFTSLANWSDGSVFGLPIETWTSDDYYLEFSIDIGTCSLVQFAAGNGIYGNSTIINNINVTSSGTYRAQSLLNQAGDAGITFKASTAGVFYVNYVTLKSRNGNHATAPSDAARPLKTSTGAAYWTNYDAVDDVLNTTFPSSLGSSCTVCRANVGAAPTILTAQTIGTSYADSTDNAGLIIINRALTGQETTDVTAWLTAKGATA